MRNARVIVLAVLAVSAFAVRMTAAEAEPIASIPSTPVTGKIQWVLNYSEGQKLARETGKPLLVVFRCER